MERPHKIDLPGYGVIDCTYCHRCLRTGFVLRLIAHLGMKHKMNEDLAIHTAVHMLDLLHKQKELQRTKKGLDVK